MNTHITSAKFLYQPATAVALAGMCALAIGMGIGRFAFTPLLTMMVDDAGLTIAMGGRLASANYVGYFAGALTAIWLPLRVEASLRTGILVIGVSTFLMGVSTRWEEWMFLRALAGFMSAWVFVFASAWSLERLHSLNRSRLSSIVYSGVGAGIALTGIVGLVLMKMHASSNDGWMALGTLALILSAAIWPAFKPAGRSGPARAGNVGHDALSAHAWRLIVAYGAFGFGYIIPATFLPVMARQFVADPGVFGWAWPVFGGAAFVSTLVCSSLIAWRGTRQSWIAGHLAMAAAISLAAVRPGFFTTVVSGMIVGGTFMVITMAAMMEARATTKAGAQRLIASMTAAFAFGQILGPLYAGHLVETGGSIFSGLALAAILLIASSALLLFSRHSERAS